MKTKKCIEQHLQDSFNTINQKHIVQGHILKFIQKGRHHVDRGIVCFPEQTYGNAEQSPEQFRTKHTLIPKNGYLYRHQNKPQFKNYSQKRYFSIDGSTNEQESKQIHLQDPENKFRFHRKKGKLTEFMDKNGWMSKTFKLMGFERDDQARQFSNKDRKKRLLQLKPSIHYQNQTAKKPSNNADYFRTLGTLTSQKMRIRTKRNQQAERFSQSVTPRQIHSSQKVNFFIDRQTVQKGMLQTARDWSPSKTSKSKCQQFSKTVYSNRLLRLEQNINEKTNSRHFSQRQKSHGEILEDWYRTTCNSKWAYQKKVQSQQDQEEL